MGAKKNIPVPTTTSSAPTSDQPLENAGTTTKQALPSPVPQSEETPNLLSPSPLGNGTFVSTPSTSDAPQPAPLIQPNNPYKEPAPKPIPTPHNVDQSILNKVVKDHLMSSKFRGHEDMVDTFFKELKKNGYSDDQIDQARLANQDLNSMMIPVKAPSGEKVDQSINKELLKKVDPLGSQWGILQPIADWSNDFADKTVENIQQGENKIAEVGDAALNALGSQTGTVNDNITGIVHGGLKTASGVAQIAFNTIPAAVAFNASTDAIKTIADKNLSKENAEKVNYVMDAPFSLGTKVANAIGYKPEEDSNGAMLLSILDFVVAAKGAGAIGEKIKSINDLKDISEKAAKNELTPEEQKEFDQYADNLKSTTIADVKAQAMKSDTPEGQEISKKIDQVQGEVQMKGDAQKSVEQAKIDHISDMKAMENPGSKEFYDKAMQAIDNPQVVDRIKNSLNEAVLAGEIPADEAQVRIDHFRKVVGIDATIPEKISDAEDRMEAGKLLNKKADLKEKVRGLDPILAADEITRVNYQVEKIDEKLNQLKTDANEKAKQAKEAGKEAELLNGGAPPPETPTIDQVDNTDMPEEKVHAIWDRVVSGLKDEDLKQGFQKEGVNYLVNKEALTESSAREILDAAIQSDKVADVEKIVLDDRNKMGNPARGVLSAMLGKHYFDLADKEVDPTAKQQHLNDFYKYTDKAAAMATEGGQAGNIIGKVVKKMYASQPETAIALMKKHIDQSNEKKIDQKASLETYEAIKKLFETPEGQAAITEEIAKKQERLFGKETQKKISDFFDNAKLKGGTYGSIIPPPVINAAIEAMKQAALLGAKGAAIIEEGIRYIKDHHKEAFDEAEFRKDWGNKLKDSGVKFGKKRYVTPKETSSVLDIIEKKAGRLEPENRDKFLKEIVNEVEKEGGLSEPRFKQLYSQAMGLPEMTPELVDKIKGYAKIINEGEAAQKKYIKALDDVIQAEKGGKDIKELTKIKDDASKEMGKSSLAAKKANEELSMLFKEDKKLSDTLIGMMQLGALTPGSIIKNISAMPGELIFRGIAANIAGPVDWMLSGLANVGLAPESWKERTINTNAITIGLIKSFPEATSKMLESFIHGSLEEDFHKREIANKITPVRAAKNLMDRISGKNDMQKSAIAANILEALPQGYLAAGFGRMLSAPDQFFRHLGEGSKAYELGIMKGLKGAELEKFMVEPDEESATKIKRAGDEFTYQQDNLLTEKIKGWKAYGERFQNKVWGDEMGLLTRGLFGALKVVSKTQALYVKTPTNVLMRTIKMISPEMSLIEAVVHLTNGKKERFANAIGDAAAAYAIRYASVSMIQAGLVTPPYDQKDEETKMESDQDVKHGGKMNYSAWTRMISGGDWKAQEGDTWVDYSKWTGSFGIALGGYAQMLKDVPKEDQQIFTTMQYAAPAIPIILKETMNLSFMSQTAADIDAIRDPNKIRPAITGTIGLLATPLLPNTATLTIKASQDTKKETRDKSVVQSVINDFKYKLLPNNDLPSKVTLFGEKVASAPAGSNPYLYYLFNVVKSENPNENSFSYKLMDIYHETKDKRVVPTAPSNQIRIGKDKITLDTHQMERLQEFVGTQRKALAQAYMESDDFKNDTDDEKGRKLQSIYNESKSIGTDMLIKSDEHLLQLKNATSNRHGTRSEKRMREHRNRG